MKHSRTVLTVSYFDTVYMSVRCLKKSDHRGARKYQFHHSRKISQEIIVEDIIVEYIYIISSDIYDIVLKAIRLILLRYIISKYVLIYLKVCVNILFL